MCFAKIPKIFTPTAFLPRPLARIVNPVGFVAAKLERKQAKVLGIDTKTPLGQVLTPTAQALRNNKSLTGGVS